jgi:hypothetical protein
MLKRTSKETEDLNLLAAMIAEEATGTQIREKNPSAVALGRLGGLKGGKARAEKLSPKRRKEIARKAALARWGAKKESSAPGT